MKKIVLQRLIITVLIAMLTACASRKTEEIGDPSLPSPEEKQNYLTIHDAFARHDTNGDGFLDQHEHTQLQNDPEISRVRKSIAELSKTGPLLFEEIDENDDGLITLNELTVIIQPLLPDRH